jgi:hypothetical protein
MPEVFPLLVLILNLALAVVLIRKYLHTRDVGFIWLGLAVVIWPALSQLLGRFLIDGAVHRRFGFYPFSLIAGGQMSMGAMTLIIVSVEQCVGVALLLVSVLYLCRQRPSVPSPSEAHAQ